MSTIITSFNDFQCKSLTYLYHNHYPKGLGSISLIWIWLFPSPYKNLVSNLTAENFDLIRTQLRVSKKRRWALVAPMTQFSLRCYKFSIIISTLILQIIIICRIKLIQLHIGSWKSANSYKAIFQFQLHTGVARSKWLPEDPLYHL